MSGEIINAAERLAAKKGGHSVACRHSSAAAFFVGEVR
jgi:hypothetical protein